MAEKYIELFADAAQMQADDLAMIERHLTISGTVLDVGCGPGHLTDHLANVGVDAVGVDPVSGFLDHARTTFGDHQYARGSAEHLPVRDGSIAGVLAWYSLIHFRPDELEPVLRELRRVVMSGGALVTGIFVGDDIEPFDHKVTTAYRWPVDEFVERLTQAGFAPAEQIVRPGVHQAGQRPHAVISATAV